MPNYRNLPAIPEQLPVLHKDGASCRMRPSPMRAEVIDSLIPSGTNLLFGLRLACRKAGISYTGLRYAKVFVDGIPIDYEDWHITLVREGQLVSVCIPLGKGGGKNPLATILSLVVVAVSIWAGPAAAGALGFVKGSLAFGLTSAFVSGAVMMGGMLLVNAIAPASQPKIAQADNETAAKVWSIDGTQNKVDAYGVVPLVLGKLRWAPRFAAKPYTVLSGNDQYVRYLYVVSMGNVQISDPRIGDTPFGNFQGCDWRIYQNWTGQGLAYFSCAISETTMSVAVKNSIGWITRTTEANTRHIALQFVFNGLKRINKEGQSSPVTVELQVRYRAVGTAGWTYYSGTRSTGGGEVRLSSGVSILHPTNAAGGFTVGLLADGTIVHNAGYTIATGSIEEVRSSYEDGEGRTWTNVSYNVKQCYAVNGFTGAITIPTQGGSIYPHWPTVIIGAGSVVVSSISFSGQTVTAQRRGLWIDVSEGQYEVSVLRVTPDSDKETTDQTVLDECTWTVLQSWRNKPAVVYQGRPLTLIEVQLKATEQLSGNVDEFNVYCQSVGPCWNGTNWVWQPTNNPASLSLNVALEQCTGKPAAMADMDLESYAAFYNWCAAMGWSYNSVQTSRTTAGEVQHNILSAGRGSYSLLNGHGVVWDDPKAPIVDILTPRNTWGFSAKKEFMAEPVHGLRMRFLNEQKDFQEDEMVVYADGYNAANATNVIEFEQDGVTNPNTIWKHGRLRLAEIRLRPEVYTLNAEAESLTLRRGEHVRCQHDVTLWGITSGRVIGRTLDTDGKIVSIELDEECTMEAGKSYGIRVSTPANPDVYLSVQTIPGVSRTLTFPAAYPVTSQSPDIGDLVTFGVSGKTDAELVVVSVTPSEGMTAQITLQDAAVNIYDALIGDVPAWDSQITSPTRYQKGIPPVPVITTVVSDETVLLRLVDGTLMPRILVNWSVSDIGTRASAFRVQYRIVDETYWHTIDIKNGNERSCYISGVQEGKSYLISVISMSDTGAASQSENITHKVIGKTSLPAQATGLLVSSVKPSYLVATWDKNQDLDFSHYELSVDGAVVWTGKEPSAKIPAPSGAGEKTLSICTVDVIGLKSPATTAVLTIQSPSAPVITTELRTDALYVVWNSSETTWAIQYYDVTDRYTNKTSRIYAEQMAVSSRAAGSYTFAIVAVDVLGNRSDEASGQILIVDPAQPSPKAIIVKNALRIQWPSVSSSFPVSSYDIYSVNGQLLQKTTGTFYDDLDPSGLVEYRIRAVDTAGNMSSFAEISFFLTAPEAPTVSVTISKNKKQVEVSWKNNASMLPVVAYDVVRQYSIITGGVQEDLEEDYGRFDVNYMTVLPLTASVSNSEHEFMVRAVDSAGNLSTWGNAVLTVSVPNAVPALTAQVLDNNVLLYWGEQVLTSFALREYQLFQVEDGYEMLLGTIDARFASQWEDTYGSYTFRIKAIDLAGNVGPAADVTTYIDQPPDFQLYHDYDSLFNGTLYNLVLDGHGNMVGPVNVAETWQQNSDRVGALLGVTNETWQQKSEGGYALFNSPMADSAIYVETVDVGTLIPSTRITVNCTERVLTGNPTIGCKIETSDDGTTWKTVAENSRVVYATQFRYCRYTLTVTGGIVAISRINYKLNVKKKTDFGTAHYNSSMGLTGVSVAFNVAFVDVSGTPVATVINNKASGGTYPYTAIVNFIDVENPTGFTVVVLDKTGTPVTADVSWQAFGV